MRISGSRLLINALLGVVLLIGLFMNNNELYCTRIAIIVLSINIVALIWSKESIYLTIIYFVFFYCNYSILMVNYIFRINNYFTSYAYTDSGYTGLWIISLFSYLLLLYASTVHEQKEIKKALIINNRYNSFICIGLILLLIFIWIFGFTRPDLEGHRGSPSTFYEYSIILLIMGFYYSGSNEILQNTFVGIIAAYALQNFYYGGRITGVQLIICVILCLYIDKIDMRVMLVSGVAFFVLMSAIGQFRASLVLSKDILKTVILRLIDERIALDTAYSSYFTSLTFLMVKKDLGFSGVMRLFGRWILSMFLGGRVPDSNLATYTRQYYLHYMGGVLPFFAYFYLGIIGIILLCIYIFRIFKGVEKVNYKSTGLSRCIAIYITSTSLRWYLYSPSQLFRGVLLLAVVYGSLYLVDHSFVIKKRLRA